jgi:hypothetical protein
VLQERQFGEIGESIQDQNAATADTEELGVEGPASRLSVHDQKNEVIHHGVKGTVAEVWAPG